MEMSFESFVVNFALIFNDFMYRGNLSSLKGAVFKP